MAAPYRLREKSRLEEDENEGWSRWNRAMVPPFVEDRNLEPRGPNQDGFICSSIRSAFPDQARHCGIYEWRAKGIFDGQPNYVVYVGSTCREKPGALKDRILEYCNDGSHKERLINDALRKGYELWVRVKIVEGSHRSKKDAEEMENDLLDSYDYAWNVRNNGRIRNILPRP